MALIAAGCIGNNSAALDDTPAPTSSAPASVAPSAPSASPTASPTTPTTEPSETPSATPSETASASPSGEAGSADLCAGNDDNRDFYRNVAEDVAWPVYCPVLPSGWFVTAGTYRLASGGWMKIAYRGPGGAHLELNEGAFCNENDGCVPAGADDGEAAFGDLIGTFVTGDDASVSVVVDRGADLSWLVTGKGLDGDELRDIAAALNRIED